MNELKQIIFKIFDTQVKGADVYYNYGSTWLIFTDKKKWVFELTKEGTLWYNYYFFKNFLELLSLEVIENENYITEWVEDTIQNRVKHTDWCQIGTSTSIEDTIQNGVRGTTPGGYLGSVEMKGNMVHQFEHAKQNDDVEDTIQIGVKETIHNFFEGGLAMEEAIQNGLKQTHPGGKDRKIYEIKDIIENGVKETNPHFLEILNPMNFEPTIKEMKRMNEVNVVLENDIKKTKYCELHSAMSAEHIIRDGIKETNWRRVDNHPTYLDNIIKSNKTEL